MQQTHQQSSSHQPPDILQIPLDASNSQPTSQKLQQLKSKPQQDKPKPNQQLNTQSQPTNPSNSLSLSQTSTQKQQKQSSNDGLNSQRSYPSQIDKHKSHPSPNKYSKPSLHRSSNPNRLNQSNATDHSQTFSQEDEDSKLKYTIFENRNRKAKLTFMKLIFMVCKKQYAFEIIRIMMYALISITVFAYVLDQNKEKKEFYEAFYSSEQITISKEINGVFPPLFGSENDIINRTWILETYNSQLKVNDQQQQNQQSTREELFFQFTPYNVLYIKTNDQTCVEQLKFKWKVFDYNMRIYQIVESDFEKIQDEKMECFPSKKEIQQKMKEVSLWTIDWESKQLYLLSEPFRDRKGNGQESGYDRWNQLIVLKKQSVNV